VDTDGRTLRANQNKQFEEQSAKREEEAFSSYFVLCTSFQREEEK
jgi:hypothetical protein